MDPFEERLKSIALRKPSDSFGKPETLAKELRQSDQSVSILERVKNMSWKSRLAVASLAATVAAVLIAASTLSDGSIAFAQVAEKLRLATTLSYKSVAKDADTGEIKTEARHYFMVPGQLRVEASAENGEAGYSVFNVPEKKLLFVDSARKVARVSSIEGFSERDMAADAIEHVRSLSDNATQDLGEQIVEGLDAIGYEIAGDDQTTTVWADAETGTPVRIEILFDNVMDEGTLLLVWTEIELDVVLDPELFSVAIPPGYEEKPFVKVDLNASPATFVAGFLRLYAKYMDGAYPAQLLEAPKELREAFELQAQEGEDYMDDLMKMSMNTAGTIAAARPSKQGDRWDYYPDTPPGAADKVIFWIRGRQGDIHAVFGDLRVAEITEDDIP